MGDYPYPVTVDGSWGSTSSKSVTNKLQIYFQSTKKSGGGDCIVKYEESSSRATVHFRSADVRGKVLQKAIHEIVIDGKKVTLSLSADGAAKGGDSGSKTESGVAAVHLSDEKLGGGTPQSIPTARGNTQVSKGVGEEVLENSGAASAETGAQTNTVLLENVPENSTEMIDYMSTAVVTFNRADDAARFLSECSKNRKYTQYGLRARALEPARSVRVENLPPHTKPDLLELYFEREKNGGGAVEDITMDSQEQAAIITFVNLKVVESVLSKQQNISNVAVKVYPYYESLGTALYGKDRQNWKMPDPFTQNIHPALLKFMVTRKQIERINDEMKIHFCEVQPESSNLRLGPLPALLKQRGLTAKHIDGWRTNVTDVLKSVLSKYKSFELSVQSSVWRLAEKEIQNAVKGDALTEWDRTKGMLALAGFATDVDEMSELVEGILQEITSQIEREKNGLTEEVFVPAAMFHILQQDGLLEKATEKFPKLKISYRSIDGKLILSGLQTEVLMIQNTVLGNIMHIKQKKLEAEPNLLSFLNEVDNEALSRDIFTSHGINALFKVEKEALVITGSSEKAVEEAEEELKSVLTFQSIHVKDREILKDPDWMKLHAQLMEAYSSSKKYVVSLKVTENQITVSGFCEPVKEVCERLSDYISTHMPVEVNIPEKQASKYNEPLMESRGLSREEPAAKFEKVEREDGLLTLRTMKGLTVTLREGNIQEAATDVIVNTISNDFNLSMGAVSNAILKAAGQELQAAIKKTADTAKAAYGDMFITDGFNLKSKKVFHVVCPGWDKGAGKAEQTLRTIINESLEAAGSRELVSLTFPAIGTGNLHFPKPLVAEVMLDEIWKFSCQSNPSSLVEVELIVHPSDRESIKCFSEVFQEQTEKQRRQSPPGLSLPDYDIDEPFKPTPTSTATKHGAPSIHSVQIGNLTLELSVGDITKETTDAIVNSSDRTFSLKSGVSKAILEGAGPAVEAECTDKAKKSDTMITTISGNLPCKSIIHIDITYHKIQDMVYRVLQECEEKKLTSVAFPALGTGQRGGNPADAADEMIKGVLKFERKRSTNFLRSLKILIFQTEMLAEFQRRVQQTDEGPLHVQKGFFCKMRENLSSLLFGSKDNEEKDEIQSGVMLKFTEEHLPPAVFQFCAERPQDLAKAKAQMQMLILQEQSEKVIEDSCIAKFSQAEFDKLKDLQKQLSVHIQLETKGSELSIKLQGLNYDVMIADCEIRDMIREMEKAESVEREVTLLTGFVEWQYQKENGSFVSFDKQTNYALEKAKDNGKTQVVVMVNNISHQVDLKNRKIRLGKRDANIRRNDLKDENLPSHWDDMSGSAVKLVELQPQSSEFREVQTIFQETCHNRQIKKIERVQNPTLWRSYQIRKKNLDDKNGHRNNERRLFHGTSKDTKANINTNGFNRSFAGKNAHLYGRGTYFALDASYSAGNQYSVPDSKGNKYMYLAKVLVGTYTVGKDDLPAPPAKSTMDPTDLYDSVVDNLDGPKMFVIFNDIQAYPEYLITFQ